MNWRTAWKLARRGLDWRFKGLRLLLACLILGTAALSAIGTLTGAIERELRARGRDMLGGDVEFALAGRPANAAESRAMAALGTVSEGVRLQAMAQAPGRAAATPVELKAVDPRWPLYGTFSLQGGPAAAPKGMTAWIAPGVADRLGVKPGDALQIGAARLTVGGVIASEPDRLGEGFALGPTVIVSREALTASGLVRAGSMARWKYRIRVPQTAQPQAVADGFTARFPDGGFGVRTRDKASPGLDRFVSRMGQFLTLVALAALSIAGIGIGNGVASYLEARRESIATLKILGATSGDVARVFLLQLACASALAIAIGLAVGVSVTPLLGHALAVETGLVIDGGALALAAIYGALIAMTFAAPPLLRARQTPAMALMRARVAGAAWNRRGAALAVAAGLAGIAGLAVITAPQKLLAAGFLGGAAALFGVLWLVGWGLTKAATRWPAPRDPVWRMALGNLHRPGAQTGALVLALGFALSAFVLLAAVETSLDANIARSVPARAPDYFVLDLPREKAGDFRALVNRVAPGATIRTVPALRGTITAFGPAERMTRVADLIQIPDDAWALKGDRGLTYAETLPEGNALTAGQWWPAGYAGPPLVSVDEKLAQALGLKLGDRITITLLGVERSATIASFRRIDWDTFGFNYVLVFSPNALADAPHNLAATIELPARAKRPAVARALLSGLVRALPSSSVIEVGPVLSQARDILVQMGTAVLAAASVAVLAGMAVLAGAIAAAREARRYDSAVLRVLGASRGQVLGVMLAEYGLLCGALALLALGLGSAVGWAVVTQLFDFEWLPGWTAIGAVLAVGVSLVMALALAGSAAVLRTRPAQVLREL
ncbi:MAG: hypothetical protein RIS94_2749 [Pseudomonadota bacterium]